MNSVRLEIDGMSCGHCVGTVRKALEELTGVDVEQVDVGSASVAYDPLTTTPDDLDRAIHDAGFEVRKNGGATG